MREILAHFTLDVPEGMPIAAAAHDLEIMADIAGLEIVDCELLYNADDEEETETDYHQRMAEEYGDLLCDVGRGT